MMRRRSLLQALAAVAAGAATVGVPAFVRHARAADVPRFSLGVASGKPHASGMVLWTMLRGDGLPETVDVEWEVADDEAFTRILASGKESARAADLWSVHAEPTGLAADRWYWYRFAALGQRSAVGRTRTAPAADARVQRLDFAITSCQRYDVGHYAAWRQVAADALDVVMFLGDYIYEYPANPRALRSHRGGAVHTLSDYRQRYGQYKSDPLLQGAHAACPWLLVWDDHEVENDYAGLQGEHLQPDFAEQRAAAYQAYWEFMPLTKAQRPVDGNVRMHGRLDWGRLARIHLLDDRQMRDIQACQPPGRGGSSTVRLAECPALLDPKRTLLGPAQERWLAEGWSLDRPWNLLAQQTLMARWTWESLSPEASVAEGQGQANGPRGRYWTDGWDGYAPARNRLLGVVADRQVPGVVVLGGDVHSHYVADLKPDYDNPKAAVVASEFCGTSISSLGLPQARVDAARPFNPHVHYARSDQRGYMRFKLEPKALQVDLQVVADAADPASPVSTAARFVVDPARPGPTAA